MLINYCLLASLLMGSLENQVHWELEHIGYPEEWVKEEKECLQVAIIGAGMAGIAAGYGLFRVGIHNIALFDAASEGEEGPWITYAKMKTLRTSKDATGPALFTPSLTFQAWYESTFGNESWEALEKPTPKEWADYLFWLRTVLELPVINNCCLKEIIPLANGHFELKFEGKESVFTKKVVLATGRKGFEIPSFMNKIPSSLFAHTSEIKDYSIFNGKDVAIIGCGTSAFDSAGAAIEAGAKSVNLLFRRKEVPGVNKLDALAHVGVEQGFHLLSDEWRYKIMHYIEECGIAPTREAILRLKPYPYVHLNAETTISSITEERKKLKVSTNKQVYLVDYIILATGFTVSVPELKNFNFLLWKDQIGKEETLGNFPYLGPHFQYFGDSPHLKHLYCFNYGALVSHGLVSCSIDALSTGALRLTQGIAADFFTENIEEFFLELKKQE